MRESNPEGDKVSRMHSVVPLFASGCVYAPDKEWAEMVINQAATFPKGKHDDLCDCLSAGIGYLRKCGSALLPSEGEFNITEELMFRGNDDSMLYDV